MARDFAKSFYQSKEWEKCRAAYIASRRAIDGGLCERCGARPGVIIHHRIHLTPQNISDPDISLSHVNLQYVCHACHDEIHGNSARLPGGMVKYRFGPDGQPVPVG